MVKCKICGYKTHVIKDNQFDIDYYECDNCEYIAMDDNYEISFSEERHVYDLHNNSIEDDGYVNYFKNFLEKGVFPFITEKHIAFLDFGSGPEPVLKQILQRDYGIECDFYDPHYHDDESYRKKRYDVITSTEVFEHLKNPLETIGELVALLNDNGILSFMTLLHPKDETIFTDWWYRRDETHISFFSDKTIEMIAKKVGVDVIYNDTKRIITFKCR